jgi:uncharacterized protein YyaL (SSP411 family)
VNRLATETSPYLRQHADNPVDWYPWGEEAFRAARATDKPLFLSVGYSSCHWCHVMAHESFEDPDTAAVMNDLFVNVKVDREERPDVDAVYMDAVQAMTGRGGWPMSVWLLPDGRPFYGGTYFPNQARAGMPSFTQVCEAVAQAWRDRRGDLAEQAERLHAAIGRSPLADGGQDPDPALLVAARVNVRSQFDPEWGGFGRAPKFPQAMTLSFLARTARRDGDDATLEMIRTSLDAMAAGGIRDHVGGGFARYSTDPWWLVPHFEKMLYDQALLTRAYTHGWLLTGEPRWQEVVEETVGYVLRDLRHPEGGFHSAEDADSEGIEGKFYVWSLAEIREIAGADADEVVRYFGVTEQGNFDADGQLGPGANILHTVDRTEVRPDAVRRALRELLDARAQRLRPGLDDKVLLEWNALFLRALTEAAFVFDRRDWMDAARANARFLLRALRRADGRFLRSWRAPYLAYAADYAALLEALCTLIETDGLTWIDDARAVADGLVDLFADPDGPGFFTTGSDAEALVVRQKDVMDNATPSANSLAANGLLRLAGLTGDDRYAQPALGVLRALDSLPAQHPTAFGYALEAIGRAATVPIEVVVVGRADDPATAALEREVAARLFPNGLHVRVDPDSPDDVSPLVAGRTGVARPTAYVCEHYACRAPVTDADALAAELDAAIAARGDAR